MQPEKHELTPIRPLAIALSVAKVEVEGRDFFPDHIRQHGGRDDKQARGLILAVASEQVGFVIVRVRGVSVVGTSCKPIRIGLIESLSRLVLSRFSSLA